MSCVMHNTIFLNFLKPISPKAGVNGLLDVGKYYSSFVLHVKYIYNTLCFTTARQTYRETIDDIYELVGRYIGTPKLDWSSIHFYCLTH